MKSQLIVFLLVICVLNASASLPCLRKLSFKTANCPKGTEQFCSSKMCLSDCPKNKIKCGLLCVSNDASGKSFCDTINVEFSKYNSTIQAFLNDETNSKIITSIYNLSDLLKTMMVDINLKSFSGIFDNISKGFGLKMLKRIIF